MSTREMAYSILEHLSEEQLVAFVNLFKDFYPNRQQLALHKYRKRGFTKGLHYKLFVTKFTHKSEKNKEIV